MSPEYHFDKRYLPWEGCYNVRDLGGLPTEGGEETRWGSLIRADDLGQLTAQGRQSLLEYGVQTIIDLRAPHEAEADPSPFAASSGQDASPTYLNLPLEKFYPHVGKLINQVTTRAEVYCIILDHYPDAMGEVMRAMANARPGGVVFHCQAGKDRTGTVAGLLLGLVDVPVEIIAADYAESQARLWPQYEQLVAQVGGPEKVEFWGRPTVIPAMMRTMLAHVETTYGGVEPYLAAAGLSLDELVRLKQRLLSA